MLSHSSPVPTKDRHTHACNVVSQRGRGSLGEEDSLGDTKL